MLLSFSVARNNLLFPVLALSSNIVLWLMPLQNYYGFVVYLLIWEPHKHHTLFFIKITTVSFRLHTMMYFMNKQSTLRTIVTLFNIIFRATLSISNPSPPLTNLSISSPKLSLLLVSLCYFTNSRWLLLYQLEFTTFSLREGIIEIRVI